MSLGGNLLIRKMVLGVIGLKTSINNAENNYILIDSKSLRLKIKFSITLRRCLLT